MISIKFDSEQKFRLRFHRGVGVTKAVVVKVFVKKYFHFANNAGYII